LMVVAGVSPQPFLEAYTRYSKWVTHSWLKSLWEKLDLFQVKVEMCDTVLCTPCTNNRWLMKVLVARGYRDAELIALNQVRCYQQVIFLSDILDSGGRAINIKYARRCPRDKSWSTVIFPQERLSAQDFCLWEQAMAELDIGVRNNLRVGSFISRGHKLWDWLLHERKGELYQVRGEEVLVYWQDGGDNWQTRRARRWHLDRVRRWGGRYADKVCTVDLNSNTGKAIITAQAAGPRDDLAPTRFQDVLVRWGRMWMWEILKWYGKNNWISSSIQDCSCIAVTDGSYI
jgi:hypothetical protein